MLMMALTAATGVFAIVPARQPSTFLSNISVPVQVTASTSLTVNFKSESCACCSVESASGKAEDLFPEVPCVGERGVGVEVQLILPPCPLRRVRGQSLRSIEILP